jgi:uncharacterized protein (TIGR02246 family)
MKYCVYLCIIALALLCACQTTTESTVETSVADIQPMADAYATATESGDVDTLVSMFTDDAMILPAEAPAVVGKEAIRSHFEASAENPQTLSINVQEVISSGDTVCTRGVFTSSTTPEGAEASSIVTGKWVSVTKVQPDGSRKIQWHIWNTDEPMSEPIPSEDSTTTAD